MTPVEPISLLISALCALLPLAVGALLLAFAFRSRQRTAQAIAAAPDLPLPPGAGPAASRGLVSWLIASFREETGVDLGGDALVLERLEKAAAKARLDLQSAPSASIDLPYITATAQGPLHLSRSITRAELAAIEGEPAPQPAAPAAPPPPAAPADDAARLAPLADRRLPRGEREGVGAGLKGEILRLEVVISAVEPSSDLDLPAALAGGQTIRGQCGEVEVALRYPPSLAMPSDAVPGAKMSLHGRFVAWDDLRRRAVLDG